MTIALSALLCGIALPAAAQSKPSLPVGEWDSLFKGEPSCKQPVMKIEADRITHRSEDTEGVCKVTSIRNKKDSIVGKTVCKWPDGGYPVEDMDGFSLIVKSPTRIVFNNQAFGLCPSKEKVQ